eukprot:364821-Chlamydomonas_euryale.AAC.7
MSGGGGGYVPHTLLVGLLPCAFVWGRVSVLGRSPGEGGEGDVGKHMTLIWRAFVLGAGGGGLQRRRSWAVATREGALEGQDTVLVSVSRGQVRISLFCEGAHHTHSPGGYLSGGVEEWETRGSTACAHLPTRFPRTQADLAPMYRPLTRS